MSLDDRGWMVEFANSELAEGKKKVDVRDELIARRVPADLAEEIVTEVTEAMAEAKRLRRPEEQRAGCIWVATGFAWLLLGILFTLGSKWWAETTGSGTYYVTYGMMVWGVAFILVGTLKALTGWR